MSPDPARPDDPRRLVDELRSRYGSDVDPAISLPGNAPAPGSGPSSELLDRLRAHAPANSRYRLLDEIGRGGMGAVLRIWDEDLRRTLAMKIVLGKEDPAVKGATPPVDTRTLGRFLEEAQVTGQLDHPGIVPVHELGLASDGRVYFTMRLVKGEDLRTIYEHVETGHDGWNETRALGVLLKVCEAMSYAHDKGVVHRDLKPENVMVGKYGEVYVMDWGLARVLGQQDRHDVRLRQEARTSVSVRTERRTERDDTPDSPLVTMDGDVVGTPVYMALEQARGEVEKLGPHSDVYAVGAMLYHLLARQMPFVPRNARVSAHTVLMRVLEGPPRPLVELAPRAPPELIAICEKAMAREANQRYPDMRALAEDLRAYLERRVVRAYETGTWAETKKWVQRNKSLAASMVAAMLILVGGILLSTKYARDAGISAKRAEDKTLEALAETRRADEKTLEATRLKDEAVEQSRELRVRGLIQDLAAFGALDDTLDYARSQRRPASDWWLERAHRLVDGVTEDAAKGTRWSPGLADAEALLAKLRERALPLSDDEKAKDRAKHPRAAELPLMHAKLQWQARMLGLEPWPDEAEEEAKLSKDDLSADAGSLNDGAWFVVDPDGRSSNAGALRFGREIYALVKARRAVESASPEQRPDHGDTLAWALLWTGHFDEALEMERKAIEETSKLDLVQRMERRVGLSLNLARIEREVGRWREGELAARRVEHEALAKELAGLESELNERRTWHFAESDDQWWHAQLSAIVQDLGRLKGQIALAEHNERDPEAAATWQVAIEAIAASERYRGVKWPRGDRLTRQLGLVPIGPDPASGLWEFSHLESGKVATRAADGTLVLEPEMGLVFVLLPGGRVPVEEGDNVIQDAALTKINLDPFFLSKYETTNQQWDQLGGWRSAETIYFKSSSLTGVHASGVREEPLNPVVGVTWDDCTAALSRAVAWLWLPTEAQWEYGCRAGTTTPWWTGEDEGSLRGAANISFEEDVENERLGSILRVGLLRGNPFGLHDVHGNATEWCRDAHSSIVIHQPGDGFVDVPEARERGLRGGSPLNLANNARSSFRGGGDRGNRWDTNGLRPVRGITP